MAEYKLTITEGPLADGSVIRTSDGARIPPEPKNRDWQAYLEWREKGGEPDAYDGPTMMENKDGA